MACAIRYWIFAGFVSTFLRFMSVRLCAWFSIRAQSQRTLNFRTGNLIVPNNNTLELSYASSEIAFA